MGDLTPPAATPRAHSWWLAALIAAGLVAATALVAAVAVRVLTPAGDGPHRLGLPVAVAAPVVEEVAQTPAPPPPRSPARTAGPRVAAQWVAATGRVAGIPAAAMRGYGQAELIMAREAPGCGLTWPTLAGIGWVESHHGTIAGRRLGDDGRSDTPVIGPVLDGVRHAAIRPTPAATAVHGNERWDHAVGPMQFIGSTWERWGADGDGDGVADPLDIDDAALAAARYLCAGGQDLRTGAGWSAAVRSYNHSDVYVRSVHAAASTYIARVNAAR